MANYGEKYIIDFANIDGKKYRVSILEKEYALGSYVLKGASSPFVLRYRDNGDEIYSPIKASEATIRFVSTAGFDIMTMLSEDDTAFKVVLYSMTTVGALEVPSLLWAGFVDGFSSTEELLDDPRTVTIKATDALGLLKKQEFRDEAGAIIYDKINLIEAVYYCIYKTGIHDLPLNVEMNIFADGMFDTGVSNLSEPLLQCKVHTRSFVKKPQEFDNCYNVLQSIMQAFNATIFQANGYWHIVRFPDRWQTNTFRSTRYLWPYASAADYVEWQYTHNVNQIDVIAINADHQRTFLPAVKSGVATYDYSVSPEYYRNINFGEGTLTLTTQVGGQLSAKRYDVDQWSFVSSTAGAPPYIVVTGDVYRLETFNLDNETLKENTLVIEDPDVSGALKAVNTVDVTGGEIIELSVETRDRTNLTVSITVDLACMYCILDTGTDYFYLNGDGEWVENSLFGVNVITGGSNTSSLKWQTVSVTSNPVPEAGTVIFSLYPWAGPSSRGTQFKNLKVSFKPANEAGQEATVSRQLDIKENLERSVKIGDPTSNTVNGALLQEIDDTLLWTEWYTYGSSTRSHLTEMLALDLYRAGKRVKTKVEGTLKGITTDLPQNDTYEAIISPHYHIQYTGLSGYVYVPSSLELNIELDSARVYLYEFYHSTWDDANEIGDSTEFKYLK